MSSRAASTEAAVATADAYLTRLNELTKEHDLRARDADLMNRLLTTLKDGPTTLTDLRARLGVGWPELIALVQPAVEAKSVVLEESEGDVRLRLET